jgi:beta-glucosidase/6-phospho-beta-glucosidase/beta-galactosidase
MSRSASFVPPVFHSPFMAGFECAYAKIEGGKIIDLLYDTKHDENCREDYQLIKSIGIATVREGLAWSQIDKGNNRYDFSRFEKMMQTGKEEDVEQIWDLNHFDYPYSLDPLSDAFIYRFAEYGKRAIEKIRKYSKGTVYIVPINEISFFAFIGADLGNWAPYLKEKGVAFKKQLVRASIAAMDGIWETDDNVRFIQVDPIFYRTPKVPKTQLKRKKAQEFIAAKFQAWDMLSGKIESQLGGHPKYLDILGLNYYYYNQELIEDVLPTGEVRYQTIPLYSKRRVQLSTLLNEVYRRYGCPMILSETGGWGDLRVKWWRKMIREIRDAKRRRLPLYGVCSYPIIDRPDWVDGHLTNSGFWDFLPNDPSCVRHPHDPTLQVIKPFIQSMRF